MAEKFLTHTRTHAHTYTHIHTRTHVHFLSTNTRYHIANDFLYLGNVKSPLCFLFICSSDDDVQQHSSALVTGSLKGHTTSGHETIEGSNVTTHCSDEIPLLSMSTVSVGSVVTEETTVQDQQQQNEQLHHANAEENSIKPAKVDSSSDPHIHSAQPKQSHSSSVPTGMYLQLYVVINSLLCTLATINSDV